MLHTYPTDYKLIFVGDASMSPYEIAMPGGSVEHWNEEAGEVWMQPPARRISRSRLAQPDSATSTGAYTHSIGMVRRILADRMFPLTLEGFDGAMRALS